jgi:hypothetical protein
MSEIGSQIFKLIPKVMADVGAVSKDRKNLQQNYTFRGIDDFINAVHGPLHKHGVFVVPKVLSQSREERTTAKGGVLLYTLLDVAFRFYAPDGSYVEAVTKGEAMDSGDKSCNKAMSAAFKYALIQIFAIPTNDDYADTEVENPQPQAKRNGPAPQGSPVRSQEPDVYSPGDMIVNYGFKEIKGRKFKDVDPFELRKTYQYIIKNNVTSPTANEFVEVYEAFTAELDQRAALKGAIG